MGWSQATLPQNAGLFGLTRSRRRGAEALQQDRVFVSIHRSGLNPNAHGLNEPLG